MKTTTASTARRTQQTRFFWTLTRLTNVGRRKNQRSNNNHEAATSSLPTFQSTNVSIFVDLDFRSVVTYTLEEEKDFSDFRDSHGGPTAEKATTSLWVARLRRSLAKSYTRLREADAQFLAYSIIDALVDSAFPIVRAYRKALDRERKRIRKTNYSRDLGVLAELKANVERLLRHMKPLHRVLAHVVDDDRVLGEVVFYLRDVQDNVVEIDEDLQTLLDDVAKIHYEVEKYFSSKQDRTVFTLTVVTTIFLPLQFFTGVWGMNFDTMPDLTYRYAYHLFWAFALTYFAILFVVVSRHMRSRRSHLVPGGVNHHHTPLTTQRRSAGLGSTPTPHSLNRASLSSGARHHSRRFQYG